jgi:hypothetical protein
VLAAVLVVVLQRLERLEVEVVGLEQQAEAVLMELLIQVAVLVVEIQPIAQEPLAVQA